MATKFEVALALRDNFTSGWNKAGGDFNRGVKNIKASWNSLMTLPNLLTAVGGATAFMTIKKYLSESREEYSKQIDAEAQLSSALGYVNKNLIDYATTIQSTTTFSDDQIVAAEAMIGSFIKEEKSIKAVTKAAVDFAAAKGMDVVSAADLFTKSIVSGTNALSRYGIKVKDTNVVEERMASLVTAVNNAYGGRAEALAKTDSGKLIQTNNLIGEQQELVGKKLLPVLNEWYLLQLKLSEASSGPLTGALQGINNWIDIFKGKTLDALAAQNLLKDAQNDTSSTMKTKLLSAYEEFSRKLTEVNNKIYELENPKKERLFIHGSFLDKIFFGDVGKLKKKADDLKKIVSDLRPKVVSDQIVLGKGGSQGGETPKTTGNDEKKRLLQIQRSLELLETVRANAIKDGDAKEIAQLDAKYYKIREDAEKNKIALRNIEIAYGEEKGKLVADQTKRHQEQLIDIQQNYDDIKISAMKEGNAKEIAQLDFKYKVLMEKAKRNKIENPTELAGVEKAYGLEKETLELKQNTESAEFYENIKINVMDDGYNKELKLLEFKYKKERESHKGNKKALLDIENSYILEKKKMTKDLHKAQIDSALDTADVLVQTLNMVVGENKKFAVAYKTVAIGQIIADTAVAAQAAFKSMVQSFGAYGIPAGIAAAAVVSGNGIARAAMVAKQKFGYGVRSFRTSGRQIIEVGDNPGGQEEVMVKPVGSQNVNGPSESVSGGNLIINLRDHTGGLIEQFRQKIRAGGETDRMIRDLFSRGRALGALA
jgi:hypothetical protein